MRKALSTCLFSSLFALTVAVACGGGSSSGTGSPAQGVPVSEQTFASEYPKKACRALSLCCAARNIAYEPATCQLFMGASQPEGSTYDAAAAGNCLAELDAIQTCDMSEPASASSCDAVYTTGASGTLAPGEACTQDSECIAPAGGSAECDFFDEVCTTKVRGKQGDLCTHSCEEMGTTGYMCFGSGSSASEYEDVHCFREDGLHCSGEGLCAPLAALGEDCNSDLSCGDGLVCKGSVCSMPTALGESCSTIGNECGDSAYCAEDTKVCVQKKPVGETCSDSFSDECLGTCGCSDTGSCSCSAGSSGDEFADAILGFFCNGGND
jgi:hypothetical protein